MSDTRPYHALSVIPDIDQKLLAGLASGKSLRAIANEFGVTDVAVLNRVRKYDSYKDTIKLSVDLRMGKRELELERATDNVSVTRADRLLGHARWLAERLDHETYGKDGVAGGSISIQVVNYVVQPPQSAPQHGLTAESVAVQDVQVIDAKDIAA